MNPHYDRHEPIISEQRLRLGIQRLLAAPLDLVRCGARAWSPKAEQVGSTEHKKLFALYVSDLREVIPEARRIWYAIVEECQESTEDHETATLDALAFAPAGAAFDGRVVAVIRKYWLACDRLNQQTDERERVSPQAFLLQWLLDMHYTDAVEVLAGMPYWPIGLDLDGNWV